MKVDTGNVKIFKQFMFSEISRKALEAVKFDVSVNYNHNRTKRTFGMCAKIKPREYMSPGA